MLLLGLLALAESALLNLGQSVNHNFNNLFISGLDAFLHDYADEQLQGMISDGLGDDYIVPSFSEWKRDTRVPRVNSINLPSG